MSDNDLPIQSMPAWEAELLGDGTSKVWEDGVKRAQKNYEQAVYELMGILQTHVDEKFAKPIKFRQDLMRQSARVRQLEGQVDDAKSSLAAYRQIKEVTRG